MTIPDILANRQAWAILCYRCHAPYLCGRCACADGITLVHGDCRDVLPFLEPDSIDLVLTDPPYGIDYQHGTRKSGLILGFDAQGVFGDDQQFEPLPLLIFPKLVLWGANHYASRLPNSAGWLIWDKRCGIASNDQSDCEMAWTNWLTTARLFSRYWNGGGITEDRFHVAQKPIGLMRWCLGLAPNAHRVLDPFAGSGTTLRAAKDLGRRCIGIEVEEKYCAIAAKRLAQEVLKL